MTKNGANGPKKRARRRQHQAGTKYTRALRSGPEPKALDVPQPSASVPAPGEITFRLADLLIECTTGPAAAWEPYDDHIVWGFHSKLLGRPIPYGAALSLAGAVANGGLSTRLTVESVSEHSAHLEVLDHPRGRWSLNLVHDIVSPLCNQPHCDDTQIDFDSIRWCRSHLVDRDLDTLVHMGQWWAQNQRDRNDCDIQRLGGAREPEYLVEAATARGTAEHLIQKLLDYLFDEEDMIDELYWDEAEAMAVKHAIDRERHRLTLVARTEASKIRKTTGACTACGCPLTPGFAFIVLSHPPQFCSPACASGQPHSWCAPRPADLERRTGTSCGTVTR